MIIITSIPNIINRATKPKIDEDMVDRINNRIVAYILMACGLALFSFSYGGTAMNIWPKPNWVSSWVQYSADYCFVEGTYYVPVNETLPKHEDLMHYRKLTFYQWAPFIYVLFGLLFTFSRNYWSVINFTSCLHMKTIMMEGIKCRKTQGMPTRDFLSLFSWHVLRSLKRKHYLKRNASTFMRLWSTLVATRYLALNYLLMKILNIAVVVVTLLAFPYLVAEKKPGDSIFSVIMSLLSGVHWKVSGLFPRVSVCSFHIREPRENMQSSLSSKVVQTVLNFNYINEKFYIVVWIGLSILLFVNALNLLRWLLVFLHSARRAYLDNIMRASVYIAYPAFDTDDKAQAQIRNWQNGVDNKKKHLENVQRRGNEKEIETAKREYEEAKEKMAREFHASTEKRNQKREKFIEDLNEHLSEFVDFLGADGYLVIRLLVANAGQIVAGGAAVRLFRKWVEYNEGVHHSVIYADDKDPWSPPRCH